MSSKSRFDKSNILYNPSLPVVYTQVRDLAEELAVLGKIDAACKIVDLLLWHHGTENESRFAEFFIPAFEQTGIGPTAFSELAGRRKGLDVTETPRSKSEDEEEYDHLINQRDLSNIDPPRSFAIAVSLCERLGQTDLNEIKKDDKVIRSIEQLTEHFSIYFRSLKQYSKLWPLLASGILAQQMGIDDQKLCITAEEILETIRTRFEKGRQQGIHEGKPIKELLEILVQNTKDNAQDFYRGAGTDPPASYFHPPATEEEIKDMEKRLDIPPLPTDYKEFLLASNGLESVYSGIGMTPRFFNTRDVVLSSLPTIVEHCLVLVSEATGTNDLIRLAGYNDWPKVTRYVEIGREYEPAFLLAVPSDVKATVNAYQTALSNDNVDKATKAETCHAIEDLYGSMKAFEAQEWAMIFDINFDPMIPVGTFRTWLEEAVRLSGSTKYGDSGNKRCLANECR